MTKSDIARPQDLLAPGFALVFFGTFLVRKYISNRVCNDKGIASIGVLQQLDILSSGMIYSTISMR